MRRNHLIYGAVVVILLLVLIVLYILLKPVQKDSEIVSSSNYNEVNTDSLLEETSDIATTSIPSSQSIEYRSELSFPKVSFNYPKGWNTNVDEVSGGAYNLIASQGESQISFDVTIIDNIDFDEAVYERLTYFGSFPKSDFTINTIVESATTSGLDYRIYEVNNPRINKMLVFKTKTTDGEDSYIYFELVNVNQETIDEIISSLKII